MIQETTEVVMKYSPTDIVLFITAIGLIITNAIKAWRDGAKIDSIKETVKVVEGHVNSAATLAKADSESKDKQIARLEELIEKMDKTAALLAQSHVREVLPQLPQSNQPIEVEVVNEPHSPVLVKDTKK